jgi:hypothetical protein
MNIVKSTLAGIAALFGRHPAAASPYAETLSTIPPGVDPLTWRIAHGEFQPDVPKRRKIETLGPDYFETRWR